MVTATLPKPKKKSVAKKTTVKKSSKRAADVQTQSLSDNDGAIVDEVPEQIDEVVQEHVKAKRNAEKWADKATESKQRIDQVYDELGIEPGTKYHVPIKGSADVFVVNVELTRKTSCKRLKPEDD